MCTKTTFACTTSAILVPATCNKIHGRLKGNGTKQQVMAHVVLPLCLVLAMPAHATWPVVFLTWVCCKCEWMPSLEPCAGQLQLSQMWSCTNHHVLPNIGRAKIGCPPRIFHCERNVHPCYTCTVKVARHS